MSSMASSKALSQSYIDEYSGGKLIGVAVAFIPILIIFVAIRFYSRHLSKTKLGLDDFLVLFSLGLQIGSSALAICFVKYGGVGRHFDAWEKIEPTRTVVYFKYLLAVAFYYFFCVAWPKLAILALYLRLFTLKTYRIIVYILASIVIATGVVCPIMSLNLCQPFEYNWNRNIPNGSCVDEQAFYRWGSLPNIFTDLAMLILPLPIVWKLHTSLKLKLGLTVAFMAGSLGLATSIVRFTSFFHGSAVQDGTWASVDLMIWTIVEPGVYLIAACLPTFRPVLIHLLRDTSLISTVSRTGYKESDLQRRVQSAKQKTGIQNTISGGFRRFDEEGDTGNRSYEDNVGLVPVGRVSQVSGDHNYPLSTIRVQNEFEVSSCKD